MAQPPGRLTSALPNLAVSGQSVRIEARIVRTSSYGAVVSETLPAFRITASPSRRTLTPIPSRSFSIVRTSAKSGTFRSTRSSAVKGGAEDGKHGVLGAGGADFADQAAAAADTEFLHESDSGVGCAESRIV